MFKIIGFILLALLGIAFIILAVATFRVVTGKAEYVLPDKKTPMEKIKENVSAVLKNEQTGKKTVIRKRTWWERLTGRA